MKNNTELHKDVAMLETRVDLLETELSCLDELLVTAGFPQGIYTLKETAIELISEMEMGENRHLS